MTPREKIYFRASGNGALMTDGKGTVLTDKQKETLDKYKLKLKQGGVLTPNQAEEFNAWKLRENAKFELSDTAKQFVQDNWLYNEKGFFEQLNTDPIAKGNFNEQESLTMLTRHTGNLHMSETKREYKNNLTGLCDSRGKINGKKIVFDIKNSWNPKTFMNAKVEKMYDWQGQTYMELYDVDEFWLVYTLTDCPEHIVAKQKDRLFQQFYSNSMSDEELQTLTERIEPLLQQIQTNLVYSNSERYTEEERIKIYKFERDNDRFKLLTERIPDALDYYQSLKLNQLILK